MEEIQELLEKTAERLEGLGLLRQASALDTVANTLDMVRNASVSDLARSRASRSKGLVIYVDMDGVLTDFVKQYGAFGGGALGKKGKPDWSLTKSVEFWKDMPWKKDGKSLWKALSPFDPIILTSPTTQESCEVGKREWVRRELGHDTRIIVDSNKWQYASPVSILIDDMEKNTDPFKAFGGEAILHKSTGETLKALRKVLDEACKG